MVQFDYEDVSFIFYAYPRKNSFMIKFISQSQKKIKKTKFNSLCFMGYHSLAAAKTDIIMLPAHLQYV